MASRDLTVLALATFVVTLTAAMTFAAGNGHVAPAEPTGKKPAQAEAPAETATNDYDVDGLVARLRDTKAIGLFTKLALKNDIDDLMDSFRRFHSGERNPPLEQLRDEYNLLFMKVITLVQKDDPELFREMTRARETLWKKLADPGEFARL
jgi:hypothetical protein